MGHICFLFVKVHITWPNGHYSEFDADWLKKRCFSQKAREKLQQELFLPGNASIVFIIFLNPCIKNLTLMQIQSLVLWINITLTHMEYLKIDQHRSFGQR